MLFSRPQAKTTNKPQNSSRRSVGRERTITGKMVDPESALTLPVVLACITLLAGDIASLPRVMYRRLKRGKERATDHRLYWLLHNAPNDEMTAIQFFEIIVGHLIGWGNFYAQKIVNNAGELIELWPLHPGRMRVDRDPKTNRKRYTYTKTNGEPEIFDPEEIWHIPGFGYDGMVGFSVIALMRNAIAMGLSTEEFGGRFFENYSQPSYVVKHPGQLSDTAFNRLTESFDEEHKDPENWHKHHILEEGMGIEKIGIEPESAQFLQTREFQVIDFARVLHIPPHMVAAVEKSTSWGTGIEQQEQGYINHTLRPIAVRIEQGIWKDLLLTSEQLIYFVEHLFDGMARGDITARYGAYNIGLNNGMLSPNEAREKENMEPYEGGDAHRVPLNTTPNNQAAVAFLPVISDAAARCLRREAHDVLNAVDKYSKRLDLAGMSAWLENFYSQDHVDFMAMQFEPAARGMHAIVDAGLSQTDLHTIVLEFAQDVGSAHAEFVSGLMKSARKSQADGTLQVLIDGSMDVLRRELGNMERTMADIFAYEFISHIMQRLESAK